MVAMKRTAALLFLLLLGTACTRDIVTRSEWLRMPPSDRVMYVSSLIGGEKARNAKGNRGRPVVRSADDYVALIDRAYEKGDQRPVPEIFRELSQ